jgi:penicillin-binding protein 1B
MRKKKWILFILIFVLLSALCGITLSLWMNQLSKEVATKMQSRSLLNPTEFFASGFKFAPTQRISLQDAIIQLKSSGYRERNSSQNIFPGDYSVLSESSLKIFVKAHELSPEISATLQWNLEKHILESITKEDGILLNFLELEPLIVSQYLENEPIRQKNVVLGEIPPVCLKAVIAIEDFHYLEHGGISFTGIFRAFLKNISSGKIAQGGSTITQQLAKNYFLTSDRTLKRKVKELGLALILESQFSKDDILETYLNIIYLGQSGTFQIRGYEAASEYYFAKNLKDLTLPDCALLAALVNGPGVYNPFTKPDKALQRRALVLTKMKENGLISNQDFLNATAMPLPQKTSFSIAGTAPYYLDAARKQMESENIDIKGAKIYTGLRWDAQFAAQKTLNEQIDKITANNSWIQSRKEKGNQLEGLILSVDTQSALYEAVVGGRNYKLTQFNRAIESQRQVGSLFKPFVYLTALAQSGQKFNPGTLIKDEKISLIVNRKKWSPDNYEKKEYGSIPLAMGLVKSLNLATVQLSQEIGIDSIIETAQLFGITSKLENVPSVALGSFEMHPTEIAQAYMGFANFGKSAPLSFVRKVIDSNGETLYEFENEFKEVLPANQVASLVSIMSESTKWGTSKAIAQADLGIEVAGKTGTTNDNKDSWFAGFTSTHLAITWVGFDNNESTHQTGASIAVPIWIDYMKNIKDRLQTQLFPWPTEGGSFQNVDIPKFKDNGELESSPQKTMLYFAN